MNEYDIGKAFAAIEEELIASMMRNMQYHRDWEDAEGFQWSMWQAEQLKALNKYKTANKKKFQRQFNEVNGSIGQVIEQARKQGNMEQELEILAAIENGWKAPKKLNKSVQTSAEFFKLNTRKLEALIKATEHDFKKAETAMLRRANDQYRKVIFNAQVYANTGAGTYEKAVDMATKDFLAAGINCIEYANGARHTIQDYADMAIRTAVKRAYLTGEGEKRQEWGISTVIINKRGNPCPKCLPFVGKIMIDDVWSGGKASDGPYPLISSAISAGLYHPRCRDSHTTYFEGISTAEKLTKKDVVAAEKSQRALQQDKYVERQAEKYGRLETYSLDSENKETYGKKSATLTQRRVERMRARKNSVSTYREMRMQRDALKSETAALEERRKAYELDFMESSDMDAARKAKEAKALIEAKNAEIADLTEKITAMQELKAKAAEEHLVSNGIAKRVKLSKAMSVEAIDEIQTVLDDLVKKRGLPPLEAIEYNPAKTMSAAAQYNWQDKTMYLGGRTKDGLKFEKERLDTEKKFHEIREKRGNVSYAEQCLQEAKEELRRAKTKEDRHFAQRKIDRLQSELNLTQKNVARSIGDVVVHEYGHHLHNLVSEQTKPSKKKQWLFGQKELGARYISGKWMHNPNSYKARLLSSQVSEYATESPLEAFAETFNAYIRGDKIPGELKILMEEAMGIARQPKAKQLLYPKNRDKLDIKTLEDYEKELAKIPAAHRDLISDGISEIEIIKDGVSRFDREKKTLYLRQNFEDGELIHEMAHVLETELNVYQSEDFIKVLKSGLDDFRKDVIYDPKTFVEPIFRLKSDKFVTKYQGRMYEEVGFINEDGVLNHFALGEYFSEGYKTYFSNPEVLKVKDAKLYQYIKELIGDGK
ncbi:putative zinc-binding metallopeptidase [Ihubacter massiliensis]|uniref:phage minor capsid protein n=1 Tax=Ihubacter massiliensis TaxID=1852367 RepID=UPI002096A537|nr:putative zinc-binding metallopeptidase [Ihubacter massiliensis]MCO7122036.1 putative zinc-binding metallopeptidase [Ihubacter massiliensis]